VPEPRTKTTELCVYISLSSLSNSFQWMIPFSVRFTCIGRHCCFRSFPEISVPHNSR